MDHCRSSPVPTFVESELAVAVIAINAAWGFSRRNRDNAAYLRRLCNTQYCNQLRGDEIDHEIGIRQLKNPHGG